MRFWDSSALVPLFIGELTRPQLRRLVEEDPAIYCWWATRVECASVLARLTREGRLDGGAGRRARADLDDLYRGVCEIEPTEDVRERAERCLAVHALRAADALQLAAALIWARERPMGMTVVSLDERLRLAAFREGFTVLPATA